MIFHYAEEKEVAQPHFKGGEKELWTKMHADENNKILLGRLKPGATVGLHKHEGSSEIIYVLEGKATVIDDGVPLQILAGEAHYCQEGHSHAVINDGPEDFVFFAVVPTHK